MKTVYFVRHAKSSWQDLSLDDLNRPLNSRGERDAPFMAEILSKKKVKADALISSNAKRAFTTARYFAKALGFKKDDIIVEPRIYEAFSDDLMEVIHGLSPDWAVVMIFGHNPTFTSLVNRFTEDYIPNVPTCGIVEVVAAVDKWPEFNDQTARVVNFYYPKLYLK